MRRIAIIGMIGLTICISCCLLSGCSASSTGSTSSNNQNSSSSSESATAFHPVYNSSSYHADAAIGNGTCAIDVSCTSDGYIGACATESSRLKLQVVHDTESYNYDLPNDGTATIYPLNMGNGTYTFRIMQNTSGNKYIELFSTSVDVTLSSETAPYTRPNVFCSYSQSSACVAEATKLCSDAQSESDAYDRIYAYVRDTITYDYSKAGNVAQATGYIPNPDQTLQDKSGICFDYASLMAAMLRSQGIPCKIITGYVAPDSIYHAWNMIYIDGVWKSIYISAPSQTWGRADPTFAASGEGGYADDDSAYTDRYIY
ncbi:MAG: transglutaminase-like domain-containing protein [Eggerthellaceae bacterium]|nr:transglutaminase-like domain-containing protein [Eggerthellaceae bacterium]MCH4221015.1 transglutaminase-like domain-containing protein [Eggerthellaceae bacterium]